MERPLTLRFVAQATLVVIALWALANLAWAARDILFVAFFAVLVASFLTILIDPLVDLGVPRVVATILTTLLLFALAAVLAVLAWPTLNEQLLEIQRQLPDAIQRLQDWLSARTREMSGSLGEAGSEVEFQLRERMRQEIGSLVGGTLPLLNTALGAVSGLFLVLFAGVFMAATPRAYADGFARLLPGVRPERTHAILHAMGHTLRKWIQATALSCLAVAILATVGLTVLGVPAPFALGAFAGVMEFVPYVGPIISGIPAVAMAMLVSPEKALSVVALYLVIQAVESNLLHPLLMKGIVKLEPALTILFQAMMATLFGFLGLLLAVPILATVKALVGELRPSEAR